MTFGPADYKTHSIVIEPTVGSGSTSGRPLYRVWCRTCEVLIHPATTGPHYLVSDHFHGKKTGYETPLVAEEPIVDIEALKQLRRGEHALHRMLHTLVELDNDGALWPTYLLNEEDSELPLESSLKAWLDAGAPMPPLPSGPLLDGPDEPSGDTDELLTEAVVAESVGGVKSSVDPSGNTSS